MIIYIFFIFLIAFVFYGLIPGVGAFLIRAQWHNFRRRLTHASLLPIAENTSLKTKKGKFIGTYRLFGTLEAIQGNTRVWIAGQDFSVAADLTKTSIYLLSSFPSELQATDGTQTEFDFPDEQPAYIPWDKIFSLPSGIQIFISGCLFIEDGRYLFKNQPNRPLLVVIYDGNKELLLERSIWSARQKNEYLNQFTPISMICGSLSLLLIAFLLSRLIDFSRNIFSQLNYYIPAVLSLSLFLFPIIYLLPPGVIFYFLYRRFWKQARFLRAERDLLKLPLRYLSDLGGLEKNECSAELPDGEKYIMLRKSKAAKQYDPLFRLPITHRECSLYKKVAEEKDYYFFGTPGKNRLLKKPQDPMGELIAIPGNPFKLAEACQKKSIKVGILSAIFIFSGLLINLVLLFLSLFWLLIYLLPVY
ncbi:MAG: hypothetical protein JW822_08985 [Spirochaetales bacterium]|nr:hypothetical protein [Spirochaetales bacterium]